MQINLYMMGLFDIDDDFSLINKEMNITIIDILFYLNDVDLVTDGFIEVGIKEANFVHSEHCCTNFIIIVKD